MHICSLLVPYKGETFEDTYALMAVINITVNMN